MMYLGHSQTRLACDVNYESRASLPSAARSRSQTLTRFALLATFLIPAATNANENVNVGLRLFRQGNYDAAAEAFANAAKESPEDERIAFDQGCVAGAREDHESARSHFLAAALSRDKKISAMSHYNLGCLAASLATKEFGDDPIQANTQQRTAGLSQLTDAARHYRDCLDIDPNHDDARHNLETIRLWIKYMQAKWEEIDKQQQDKDDQDKQQSLLELLKSVEERQITVHDSTYAAAQTNDKSSVQLESLADQQLELVGEVDELAKRIQQELAPSTGSAQQPKAPQPASPQSTSDSAQQAIQALTGLATRAKKEMLEAEVSLRRDDPNGALHPHREALANLGDIYLAISPFSDMLQRSIEQEEKLLVNTQQEISERTVKQDRLPDTNQLAWRQSRVRDWVSMLSDKANRELEQTPTLTELEQMQTGNQTNSKSAQPGPTPAENEKEREDLQGLRTALERAVKLAPTATDLTDEAAMALRHDRPADALPKEEEALRLLKEIAETLPKQNNQQRNQDSQDQNQDNQDNQDQQDQQDQSQQNQDDQQEQDQQQGQQNEQEEPSQKDDQQQQQPSDGDPQPAQQFTRQQAEAILQRARQREREYRQHRQRMRRLLSRDAKVEKDW